MLMRHICKIYMTYLSIYMYIYVHICIHVDAVSKKNAIIRVLTFFFLDRNAILRVFTFLCVTIS